MPVQIGAKLDSGFDDPLGMLRDCHRRIERFLRVLCEVARRAQGRALSDEEQDAVRGALHYFREGGERHNRDEEDSLFPRLRQAGARDDRHAIEALEHEHSDAGALHGEVDRLYRRWMTSGALVDEETRALLDATGQLESLYATHIAMEETVVFPHAAKVLDAGAIATMGEEFRARRS
ncbi:MAG TPA: hemerythrin domain-containing protein [Acidobacteriaceae bacterium]|jgi:hemerythrin-like domain-containing protein|nr:hemerythrin domain-containing protein [Acidobacteriaceae bacterium]